MPRLILMTTKIKGQREVKQDTICNDEEILEQTLSDLIKEAKEEIEACDDYDFFKFDVVDPNNTEKVFYTIHIYK